MSTPCFICRVPNVGASDSITVALDAQSLDYVLITDFNQFQDVIQFNNSVEYPLREVAYSLGASPQGLPTGIFITNLSIPPELIAILEGVVPESVSFTENFAEGYFKLVAR